jgi:hypothetical protein
MDPGAEGKISNPRKDAPDVIVEVLRSRDRKARFVTELYAALEKFKISPAVAEGALAQLESAGAIMVRDHFCADPHLEGVDLRVATLVEGREGEDPQLSAIGRIDETWNRWLSEYLANHRCG